MRASSASGPLKGDGSLLEVRTEQARALTAAMEGDSGVGEEDALGVDPSNITVCTPQFTMPSGLAWVAQAAHL